MAGRAMTTARGLMGSMLLAVVAVVGLAVPVPTVGDAVAGHDDPATGACTVLDQPMEFRRRRPASVPPGTGRVERRTPHPRSCGRSVNEPADPVPTGYTFPRVQPADRRKVWSPHTSRTSCVSRPREAHEFAVPRALAVGHRAGPDNAMYSRFKAPTGSAGSTPRPRTIPPSANPDGTDRAERLQPRGSCSADGNLWFASGRQEDRSPRRRVSSASSAGLVLGAGFHARVASTAPHKAVRSGSPRARRQSIGRIGTDGTLRRVPIISPTVIPSAPRVGTDSTPFGSRQRVAPHRPRRSGFGVMTFPVTGRCV